VTVSRSSDIVVVKTAGGRARVVTQRNGRYLAVSSPTWSPNGRRVAFARQACSHCPYHVVVAALSQRSVEPLEGWHGNANEPTWSPLGGRLAFTTAHEAGERDLVLFGLRDRRGLRLFRGETEGRPEEEVESPNHPAFSPDGRSVAFEAEITRERTRIFLFDLADGGLHMIENDAVGNAHAAFSPDGERIAFSQTDHAFTWDLCTVRRDGRDQICLTRGSANDVEPSWSPDGRSIVFASDRDDPKRLTRSLYLVRPDGTGLRRLTKGFDDGAPAFSPDGSEIAFVRRQIHRIGR
jgi:Tol biopolymer transport system component